MGDKAKAPALPDTAPRRLREFVECTRDTYDFGSGQADWISLDWLPSPDIQFETDPAKPGSVTIVASALGGYAKFKIPAGVKDGHLEVDPSALPMGADKVRDWAKNFNDWLDQNGKRLGEPKVERGVLKLTKAAVGAARPAGAVPGGGGGKAPPSPPPTPPKKPAGIRETGLLPHVPTGEKVLGGVAAAAFALFAFSGANLGDSSTTETREVAVDAPAPDKDRERKASEDAALAAALRYVDTWTDHGPNFDQPWTSVYRIPLNGLSVNGACGTVDGVAPGSFIFVNWNGAAGPFQGSGVLDANGRFIAPAPINAYGDYVIDGFEWADPANPTMFFPIPIADDTDLNVTITDAESTCDLSALPIGQFGPTGGGTSEPPESPSGGTATITDETTHNGFPWSIPVGLGGAFIVGGALTLDERRRRLQTYIEFQRWYANYRAWTVNQESPPRFVWDSWAETWVEDSGGTVIGAIQPLSDTDREVARQLLEEAGWTENTEDILLDIEHALLPEYVVGSSVTYKDVKPKR